MMFIEERADPINGFTVSAKYNARLLVKTCYQAHKRFYFVGAFCVNAFQCQSRRRDIVQIADALGLRKWKKGRKLIQ